MEEADRVNVYRYMPDRRKFEKLPLKEDVIRSFDISRNGRWATYTGVSVSNSNRGYLLDLKTGESTLISDPYAKQLNTLELGEVVDWKFTSSFGDEIDGRYYLPPNFDPAKKYPLIVYYYGGTSPTSRGFKAPILYTCMLPGLCCLYAATEWHHRIRAGVLCPARECLGRTDS